MITYTFDDSLIPHDFLLKVASFFSDYPGCLYLHSSDVNSPSYLALFPYEVIQMEEPDDNPWQTLKRKLGSFKDNSSPIPLWMGYLSYEMGAYSDPDFILEHTSSCYPLAYFQKSAVTLELKNGSLKIYLSKEQFKKGNDLSPFFERSFWEKWIQHPPTFSVSPILHYKTKESDSFETYLKKIERAQERIKSGDIYQVNLSRSSLIETNLSAFEIFYRLTQTNPVPFSAFLGLEDFQIISASPERFLKYSQGLLETCPIKGTVARGNTNLEDEKQMQKLLTCSKQEAELAMICDLMRNDLGKISEIGSVNCVHFKRLLSLSNVFHLESVIQSKALKKHPVDLVRACFPAGSITGCPKISSMKIIQEIEQRARHIYCGSIGYFTHSGDFDFNVAIRTGVYSNQTLEIQLGGAITYDSQYQDEYSETQNKGSPFTQVLKEQSLTTQSSELPEFSKI